MYSNLLIVSLIAGVHASLFCLWKHEQCNDHLAYVHWSNALQMDELQCVTIE